MRDAGTGFRRGDRGATAVEYALIAAAVAVAVAGAVALAGGTVGGVFGSLSARVAPDNPAADATEAPPVTVQRTRGNVVVVPR